jgi:hypothetical protein
MVNEDGQTFECIQCEAEFRATLPEKHETAEDCVGVFLCMRYVCPDCDDHIYVKFPNPARRIARNLRTGGWHCCHKSSLSLWKWLRGDVRLHCRCD